jgi:cobyrinic acid a,c-diamide synthase
MSTKLPRLLIAGISGDSGKTIISLSLVAAFVRRGLAVSTFKKGPDYIDAAWLGNIAGSACRNLDTFLASDDDVLSSFGHNAAQKDISLIEGNRGIYDGKDAVGTHSTAGLAAILKAPIVLVVDVTKSTRTIAALVKGIIDFDLSINIAGIILNKIGGNRHKKIVSESIAKYCDVPILGAVPRLGVDASIIPGRHLGLVTPSEYLADESYKEKLRDIEQNYIDTNKIIEIANNAAELEYNEKYIYQTETEKQAKIGYFADSVFTFYYPENLEALENHGAELIPISSIENQELPDIDALYIGGGFPETQAEKLAQNKSMMDSVRKASVSGMPIYAECGGLIYLSRSLAWGNKMYPMAGIFPVDLIMHDKPVGHGYTKMAVDEANPFFDIASQIKGHEFHYSGVSSHQNAAGFGQLSNCMRVETGIGLGNGRDGLLYNNTFACYSHIHALGEKNWARNMVKAAKVFKTGSGQGGIPRRSNIIQAGNSISGNVMLMATGN